MRRFRPMVPQLDRRKILEALGNWAAKSGFTARELQDYLRLDEAVVATLLSPAPWYCRISNSAVAIAWIMAGGHIALDTTANKMRYEAPPMPSVRERRRVAWRLRKEWLLASLGCLIRRNTTDRDERTP
jgi:hypothetical protein